MHPLLFAYRLPTLLAEESPSLIDVISEGQSYNYWGEFVNMIVSLLAVLSFIFLTVWILRRVMGSKLRRLNQGASIRILERRALGQKSSLYLVEILGKGVVISESAAGISLIKEFSNEINIQELIDQRQDDEGAGFIPIKEKLAEKFKKMAIKRA